MSIFNPIDKTSGDLAEVTKRMVSLQRKVEDVEAVIGPMKADLRSCLSVPLMIWAPASYRLRSNQRYNMFNFIVRYGWTVCLPHIQGDLFVLGKFKHGSGESHAGPNCHCRTILPMEDECCATRVFFFL